MNPAITSAGLTFNQLVKLKHHQVKPENGAQMVEVKVSPKGQVVIPKELREEFGIRPGQKVTVEGTDEGILILQARDPVKAMRGLFKGKFKVPSVEWIRKSRKEWERRLARK